MQSKTDLPINEREREQEYFVTLRPCNMPFSAGLKKGNIYIKLNIFYEDLYRDDGKEKYI